jgi:hypothetical protein
VGCATGIEFNLDLAEFGGEYDADGLGAGQERQQDEQREHRKRTILTERTRGERRGAQRKRTTPERP